MTALAPRFHTHFHACAIFHASLGFGPRRFSTLVAFSTLLEGTSVERSVERFSLEKPPFFGPLHSFHSYSKEKKIREKKRAGKEFVRLNRGSVEKRGAYP
jgi:hypothetical protein